MTNVIYNLSLLKVNYPLAIKNLITMFSCLPSVGPRTAERYVFYLLNKNPEELQEFAQNLAELKEKTAICAHCNCITENNMPPSSNPVLLCSICADNKRNKTTLCIIADTRNMLTIEGTKQYNGLYFCLGQTINIINDISPSKLPINQLITRIKENLIKETIIALDPSMEGETTTMYLIKLLKPYKTKITRLARGLPMGATLEYADDMTLGNALKYRDEI